MNKTEDKTKRRLINLKSPRNPELEQLRESVLSQKVNYNDIATRLKDQLKTVHAAYLFNSAGRKVLATLCKVISSTPTSPCFSSWKDLGGVLGLSGHELGCIEQYKFGDPSEIVLKTYSQNWDSTLAQIVAALQAINRFDAIVETENGLQDLAKVARQEQVKRTEDLNEGLYSLVGKATSDGILRPEHVASLSYQLPITLQSLPERENLIISDIPKCEVKHLRSSIAPNNNNKKEKKI